MSRVRSSSPFGGGTVKIALIPVLGLILAGVVFWPGDKAGLPAAAVTHPPAAVKPSAAQPADSDGTRPSWPAIRFEDLVAFNPLEPRGAPVSAQTLAATTDDEYSDEEADAEETPVAQPPTVSRQLQAIYQDARGAAAIVDSRIVRVGDLLDDGSRVSAITAEGVLLERE